MLLISCLAEWVEELRLDEEGSALYVALSSARGNEDCLADLQVGSSKQLAASCLRRPLHHPLLYVRATWAAVTYAYQPIGAALEIQEKSKAAATFSSTSIAESDHE